MPLSGPVSEEMIIERENVIKNTDIVDTVQHLNSNFETVINELINYLNTVDNRPGTKKIANAINGITLDTYSLMTRAHINGSAVTHTSTKKPYRTTYNSYKNE